MALISGIIDRALEKAGIKDPSQTAEAEDVASALDELNDMMMEWHQKGIWIGYSEASAATENNTAYRYAHGGMKSGLCLRLCAEFQRPVPTGIVAVFQDQMGIILREATEFPLSDFPPTFPKGSGNTHQVGYDYNEYFVNEAENELSIAGGTLTQGEGRAIHDGSVTDPNADTN